MFQILLIRSACLAVELELFVAQVSVEVDPEPMEADFVSGSKSYFEVVLGTIPMCQGQDGSLSGLLL